MEKYALLIINMLNDFVYGDSKYEYARDVISPIREISKFFREQNFPVIYICDSHLKNFDREVEIRGEHAIDGTSGAKIIDELNPKDGDYTIKKRKYSGFYGTGLDELLREMGMKNLVFSGLLTSLSLRHTVADAYYRSYRCIMLTNACCDVKKDLHLKSILYIRDYYGATAVSTMNFPRLYVSREGI
ncbi:MAG TPA: isochorismatase family cysteine hydrolase [Methanofastidiosum sp.]|jgi:nicotinamidase-related amidase|nr:cysteine hydrolase [Methanofastidiosum sp.]HNZ87411.1 isochorismatase family cysteine hydrolase [Methanofastidiosum sp.]HOC78058.1 isochorismatase family cysteine hydrolase [Methanofastidiosum sp.]HOG73809.1 isochorismatase family cysteine hydrolase [Methanofastidiosum sp.]HPA49362.1 isochorismatase family cysteine hydrolase [Methanofastidiosum sp.]